MKLNRQNLLKASAAFALAISQAWAVTPVSSQYQCLKSQILEKVDRYSSVPGEYRARVQAIESACAKKTVGLCREPSLGKNEVNTLVRAAAQLENPSLRDTFLQSFPLSVPLTKNADLQRLLQYVERRLKICEPPVHDSCRSERWQSVFEDYLARSGKSESASPRYLRRWTEDQLGTRIPGLNEFLHESTVVKDAAERTREYQALIEMPGLSVDSICIISEQSCKKPLNDVNKALSDALGSARLRMFRAHLNELLQKNDRAFPSASRIDFKTDRMIELFVKAREDDPRRFEAIVNEAARLADQDFGRMIDTRFPELMYVTGMNQPERWFNTASFSLPGYSIQLNETLAAFKARQMRGGTHLSNEQARDEFVGLAQRFIKTADDLRAIDRGNQSRLIKAGVIEANGAFTRKTAELLRKLPSDSTLGKVMEEVFHGIQLSELEQKLILQQWKAQDFLSIPLSSIDQMGQAPKDTAILGGDGIGGGAIDAWSKARSLLDHRAAISSAVTSNDAVKRVFDALSEADLNASLMIRTAPLLLQQAIHEVSPVIKKRVGFSYVMTSADDAVAPLKQLASLKDSERNHFYETLAQRLSEQKRTLKIRRNGSEQTVSVGPELLRAFIGFNKESAEAAETFLKPFEERLSKSDLLGPKWRDLYPKVAFLSVRERDGRFKLFIAGDSLNEDLKRKLTQGLQTSVRNPADVELRFVSHP